MSLVLLPTELAIKIMFFLGIEDASRLGRSAKALLRGFYSEPFWAIKLELKFGRVKYQEMTSIESYKWCFKVDSVSLSVSWRNRLNSIFSSVWRPGEIHFSDELKTEEDAFNKTIQNFFMMAGPTVITDKTTMLTAIQLQNFSSDNEIALKGCCLKYFRYFKAFQ